MTIPAICSYALGKLESGAWSFHDGSELSDIKRRDLLFIIYGAAAEINRRDHAYDALWAIGRRLKPDDFRSPFYRTPGVTQEQLVATLRMLAEEKIAA